MVSNSLFVRRSFPVFPRADLSQMIRMQDSRRNWGDNATMLSIDCSDSLRPYCIHNFSFPNCYARPSAIVAGLQKSVEAGGAAPYGGLSFSRSLSSIG